MFPELLDSCSTQCPGVLLVTAELLVVLPSILCASWLLAGQLGTGEDDDYLDDFNSASRRSEKSELSIGEEIEEDLSVGADDINTSDKLDDLTQDLTVSQLSDVADYLEDVA